MRNVSLVFYVESEWSTATHSLAAPWRLSWRCLPQPSVVSKATRKCRPWAPCRAHRAHPCLSTQYQFYYPNVSLVLPISLSAHLRNSFNSPADLAHVEVLISRPSPAPWRVARTLPSIFRRACSSSHIARSQFSLSIQFVGQCVRKGAVSDARRVMSKRAVAPSGFINAGVQLRRSVYSAGDANARVGWMQVGGVAIMGGFGSGLFA